MVKYARKIDPDTNTGSLTFDLTSVFILTIEGRTALNIFPNPDAKPDIDINDEPTKPLPNPLSDGLSRDYLVQPTETLPGSTPAVLEKERKKDLITIIVWGCIVLAVLVGVLIYTKTRKTTIELNDYITITTEGYDTVGTAAAAFDSEAFLKAYKEVIRFKGGQANTKTGSYDNAAAALLAECVDGSLNHTDALKNGDTVTFVWDIDTEKAAADYHVKLLFSNIDQEISDLPMAEPFDPFGNISLQFDGRDGSGTLTLNEQSTTGMYELLTYAADVSDGLSNGDTVIVRVSAADGQDLTSQLVAAYGKMPSVTEKSY